MSYVLGIDLGATRTKAAVSRPDAEPEAVALDGSSRWVDSVVYLDQDAAVSAGQHARAMVEHDPDGVVSGFVAQVGDEVGVLLGGDRYSGEVLTAALAGWVTDRVAAAERAEPGRIVLAHPPGWGAHRRAVLHDALADAGMPSMALVPAPIAAAHRHAARKPVDVGALLAVCRIGGERADGTVLRRTPDGFDLLAHVDGPRGAAGAALDDALVEWVREQVSDPPSPARLRSACVVAKERLSVNEEVVVPVGRHGVRLTRAEFDRIARPVLTPVLDRLRRLIDAAQGPRPVAVELVGGTARVPVLAELAAAALGCPAEVDPDPATAICRGVVQMVAPHRAPGRELVTAGAARARDRVPADPPPRPPISLTPLEPPKRRRLQLPTRRRDRSDEDGRLDRSGSLDRDSLDRDEFLELEDRPGRAGRPTRGDSLDQDRFADEEDFLDHDGFPEHDDRPARGSRAAGPQMGDRRGARRSRDRGGSVDSADLLDRERGELDLGELRRRRDGRGVRRSRDRGGSVDSADLLDRERGELDLGELRGRRDGREGA
ncbi:Hsp70 family protein [Labedaea rhizosphaerae]|uniref:Hsp70 protein n=1 Tax=Labedaea rhizosphaerae TaxID=598644 RepID=A0A4V6PVV8_LABRH|nr:Hsp70 family protein [Labedaea rhizosphaerae]TDQ01021.1 Hsp70 protein [Labedaea rhizosphaerae]